MSGTSSPSPSPSPYGSYRFVDPRILAALDDLELAARTIVDGLMFGVHPSRLRGPGMEFSQYRSYEPGDDPRRLDWKLYGRSDRYFVRESDTDTSLTIRLVLDATRSMAHEEDGLSKFDYARLIAAALALLGERQGDAVGLAVMSGSEFSSLPPRRGHQHLHRLLHHLEGLSPRGRWPELGEAERAIGEGVERGITVILTDFHEAGDEIFELVRRITTLRHETTVMHILGRRERDLDWHGAVSFEDLETGAHVEVDPDQVRESYRSAYHAELERVRRDLEDRGARFETLTMDQPVEQALRQFLIDRERSR